MKKTKTSEKDPEEVAELDADIDQPDDLDVVDTDIDVVDPDIDVDPAVVDIEVVAVTDDAEADDDDDEEEEEGEKALDEMESEELGMLTEDEESETIHVDERAEARAIRREALALEADADAKRDHEFVCQSCFLVKRTSQLANKSKKICSDCAA
ncbi:MAG: DUF4193 family protein [Acidimicrobiia bacterium]|nr:DUF4193 family protein [Acidimicrobiia bacterium]